MLSRFLASLTLVVASLSAVAADDKELAPITSGESVFVAKLTSVKAGPVGLSNPPVRTYTFQVEVSEQLRGKKPTGALGYQIRSENPPAFPMDEKWLVAARRVEKGWQVTYIGVASKETLEKAKTIAALPAGWTIADGKPVSPWAGLKDKAWPQDAPKPAGPVCSKTGRPALLAGDAIEFTVAQVPAANPQKFRNDMYGDGQFKITVKNTSDKAVEVPALLTDGKTIFWADSVMVMANNEPRILANAGKAQGVKPVSLKPGESVTGVIDTLLLDGMIWPRGGQRVYFDFALGEKTATNFFYYFSNLHDGLRDAAWDKLRKQ